MSSPFKTASSMFITSGALTYFSVSDLANVTKGAIDTGGAAIEGAWNKDEEMYRHVGESMGEVIGSAAGAGVNFGMLVQEGRLNGYRNAFLSRDDIGSHVEARALTSPNGAQQIYGELHGSKGYQKMGVLQDGKFNPVGADSKVISATSNPRLHGELSKSKYGGVFKNNSKFVSASTGIGHMLKSNVLPIAAMMALGHVASGVLGFAGGLVDQATKDYHREKTINYDNRFFNTQYNQQSAYQTLGMAMNNMENRMQSTARIFHSR